MMRRDYEGVENVISRLKYSIAAIPGYLKLMKVKDLDETSTENGEDSKIGL